MALLFVLWAAFLHTGIFRSSKCTVEFELEMKWTYRYDIASRGSYYTLLDTMLFLYHRVSSRFTSHANDQNTSYPMIDFLHSHLQTVDFVLQFCLDVDPPNIYRIIGGSPRLIKSVISLHVHFQKFRMTDSNNDTSGVDAPPPAIDGTPIKEEKLQSIMEAANALTALGDEEDASDANAVASPLVPIQLESDAPSLQPSKDDTATPLKPEQPPQQQYKPVLPTKRFLPDHKKPDAAPTFPEKVRRLCTEFYTNTDLSATTRYALYHDKILPWYLLDHGFKRYPRVCK